MAFQSANGYGQLAAGVFSPTIYSRKVQKAFRKNSVAEAVTNTAYYGEIADYGDTVRVIKEPEISITPYARGMKLTPQELQDEDYTLTVDRANAFAFRIDDIESKQSHVDWMELAADRAAYQLKDAYDADILGYASGYEKNASGQWVARTAPVGTKAISTADNDELLAANKLQRSTFASGGTGTNSITLGTKGTYDTTPLGLLNRIQRIMDINNIPTDERFVIFDPVFAELLMDEDSKFINQFYVDGNGKTLMNGRVGGSEIRGFKTYKSNNLPFFGNGPGVSSAGGSASNFGVILAGHMSAIATASQINKTEKNRDPYGFGEIVKGMQMYGRKICRPEALVTAKYNVN